MASPRSTPARDLYSLKFLARYGQRLQREELRLVQGFRALPPQRQRELLDVVAQSVLHAPRQ